MTDQNLSLIGSPPLWKDLKLHIGLSQAALKLAAPKLAALKAFQPRYRDADHLSMLMLSARITPSEFRYDEVDIITHNSLLGTLFKF